MKASVTSDADTPGHHSNSTIARRRMCLRVSVRVDWIELLITSESSLLARGVNVTCVFREIDSLVARWFAKNVSFCKNILSRQCLTPTWNTAQTRKYS